MQFVVRIRAKRSDGKHGDVVIHTKTRMAALDAYRQAKALPDVISVTLAVVQEQHIPGNAEGPVET